MAVLHIYLPKKCISEDSGFLLGKANQTRTAFYVTSLLKHPGRTSVDTLAKFQNNGVELLGVWNNTLKSPQDGKLILNRLCESWIDVYGSDMCDVNCLLNGEFSGKATKSQVILVQYNADEVLASLFTKNGCHTEASVKDIITQTLPSDNYRHSQTTEYSPQLNATVAPTDQLAILHQALVQQQEHISPSSELLTDFSIHEESGKLYDLQNIMFGFLVKTLLIFSWLTNRSIWRLPGLRRLVFMAAVSKQLKDKSDAICNTKRLNTNSLRSRLLYNNVLWQILVDCVLGIFVLLLFVYCDIFNQMSNSTHLMAESVAVRLQQLLMWLMGVPAGLKLNSHLTKLLGKFFMYHIYLWTGYLQFFRPVLDAAFPLLAAAGCLGLSVQVALLQDLLSMMTIHIYCFYVYAARLYYIQRYVISSLWRLFRGKKWNELRQRVDHASYDVDQLFMGTLLLTILLFLLPTTALYYVVFTALRLVLLGMQAVLHMCKQLVSRLPLYLIYLKILESKTILKNIKFHVLPRPNNSQLSLLMELLPASLSFLKTEFQCPNSEEESYTWREFVKKLLEGHLVYPWVEKETTYS